MTKRTNDSPRPCRSASDRCPKRIFLEEATGRGGPADTRKTWYRFGSLQPAGEISCGALNERAKFNSRNDNCDFPRPRGVVHSYADGKIQDTGPLTIKRMETVDEEITAAAIDFMDRQAKAGKPLLLLLQFDADAHLDASQARMVGGGTLTQGSPSGRPADRVACRQMAMCVRKLRF